MQAEAQGLQVTGTSSYFGDFVSCLETLSHGKFIIFDKIILICQGFEQKSWQTNS